MTDPRARDTGPSRFAEPTAANDARFGGSLKVRRRAAYASLGLAPVILACAAAVLLSACDGDSNWVYARNIESVCLAANTQGRTLNARYPIESECWR